MKSVLNYFVRKAFGFKSTATAEDKTLFGHLLRIRQNIQGVYDWLYGKVCGYADGTIPRYMPMTEAVTSADGSSGSTPVKLRPVLQNTDTLLAHLRLLDNRKISNGYADGTPADDGQPDGVSLARILCDSSLQPTALIDDNVGWVMDKTPAAQSAVTRLVLGAKQIDVRMDTAFPNITELYLPNCEDGGYEKRLTLDRTSFIGGDNSPILSLDVLYAPKLEGTNGIVLVKSPEVLELPSLKVTYKGGYNVQLLLPTTKKLILPNFDRIEYVGNATWLSAGIIEEIIMPKYRGQEKRAGWGSVIQDKPYLKKVVFGRINLSVTYSKNNDGVCTLFANCPSLIHFEIAQGTSIAMNLESWSPTLDSSNLSLFLDNFLHFIAERVAEGNYTLTLSAAVFSSIWDADGNPAVIGDGHDELRAAINTELRYNKHWNVNKA